jgi:microcystin-dependent protein
MDGFVGMVGMIVPLGFPWTPQYWAACDGSVMPVAQNSALFSLIQTQYGGDGQRTFNLPDLRGRMVVGQGQGPGLSRRIVGQMDGAETVNLLASHLPPHEHPVSLGGSTSGTGGTMAAAGSGAVTPMPSGVTGRGEPVPIMPPSLTINFQIALEGIFPWHNA